jgi:hypothetical protein
MILAVSACNNEADPGAKSSTTSDSLEIDALNVVISTDSEILGEPREIVNMDEDQFAVYDHAYKKIMVFDKTGEKKYEFGNTGEGPGEWDPMGGARDLSYHNGTFFSNNGSRYLFDLYNKDGSHIKSISYEPYLDYAHKLLIDKNRLLTTTNGGENSLAVVLDLENELAVIDSLGEPAAGFRQRPNFEEQRTTYANGELPEGALNEALVTKIDNDHIIFMNTLGEMRRYSQDGEILFEVEIPSDVKETIFNYIVDVNKNESPPHSVRPLEYAKDIQHKNGLIYLFMPIKHPDREGLEARFLIYNKNGSLLSHYVFKPDEKETILYDFTVDEENVVYFVDVMNARVLSFDPEIET